MEKDLKVIEGEIVPIYENTRGEKLINARELHEALKSKRQFANWIKQRIEHYKFAEYQDFFTFNKFVKRDQNDNLGSKTKEYYLTIGNQYYQIYYKSQAVKEIIEWFNKNKEEVEYKIIYERNTKNGKKGEVKEQGYKIENVCYKVTIF